MPFGGQERVFKFGNITALLLSKNYDLVAIERDPFLFIPSLFWAALKAREKVNNLPADFSEETVCEWMDEAGEEACTNLLLEGQRCLGFMTRLLQNAAQKASQ